MTKCKKEQPKIGQPDLFDSLMNGEIWSVFYPAIPLAQIIPPSAAELIVPTKSFVEDVHKRGLIDALTLREIAPGQYRIICGCRRWYALALKEQAEDVVQALVHRNRALQHHILTGTVKAEVLADETTDEQASALALRSNAQREDNILSDIRNIKHLMSQGLSPRQITQITGKKQQTITKLMKLVMADRRIFEALCNKQCVEETAFAASKLPATQQQTLLEEWEESGEERLTMEMVQAAQRARVKANVAKLDRSLFSGENDPAPPNPKAAATAEPYIPPAGEMWAMLKAMRDAGALDGIVDNTAAISQMRRAYREFVDRHLEAEGKRPVTA